MPEHVRFEQGLYQCRTIDCDKWSVRGRAYAVDVAGHQLFAGTTGPLDQYCHRFLRNQPDGFEDLFHQPAVTNNTVAPFTNQTRRFHLEPLATALTACDCAFYSLIQFTDIDRLGDIVIRSELHGRDGAVHIVESSDHDHWRFRETGLEIRQRFQAALPWHTNIHDDYFRGHRLGSRQAVSGIVGQFHSVVRAVKMQLQSTATGDVIIDNQYLTHGFLLPRAS